jgi:nucleotide-binding universal stress UspA family protein
MKQLLVAVDLTDQADLLVDEAARLAKALRTKLWVLHVMPSEIQAMLLETSPFTDYTDGFGGMPGDIQLARDLNAEEIKREHTQLLSISARLRNEGVEAQAILLRGSPARIIAAKAEELNADIIILGSRHHGRLHKTLLGSVSEYVMHHTRSNIMLVPMPSA